MHFDILRVIVHMFDIKYCPGIFSEKQKTPLIKTRDLKISYGSGGHCNICMLIGLCLVQIV